MLGGQGAPRTEARYRASLLGIPRGRRDGARRDPLGRLAASTLRRRCREPGRRADAGRALIGVTVPRRGRERRGGACGAHAQARAPSAGGWAERAPRAGAGERGEGAERAAKRARARLGTEGGGPWAGTAAASGGSGGGGGS